MSDTNTYRTLVVDDSKIMRNIVMETLRKSISGEFDFIEAASGAEAMEVFDADAIDIIFVDWNMPGMNGLEFARFIRSSKWANHIPIIMVTSETGDAKQKDAFDKARISCYITKPFTADDMRAKVAPIFLEIKKRKAETAQPAAQPAAKPTGGFFSKLLG